jgi:hypothetical protein
MANKCTSPKRVFLGKIAKFVCVGGGLFVRAKRFFIYFVCVCVCVCGERERERERERPVCTMSPPVAGKSPCLPSHTTHSIIYNNDDDHNHNNTYIYVCVYI